MIISTAIKLADWQHIFELKHLFVVVFSFMLFLFIKTHLGLVMSGVGLMGAIIR